MRNDDAETPLHSAVDGNNVADVKLLLRNNANANSQDNDGNTPLHISSPHGLSNISQLLKDSVCNKSLKNRKGETPLELNRFSYSPYLPYPGN